MTRHKDPLLTSYTPGQLPNLIDGFLSEPRHAADGTLYRGRAALPDVQWAINPEDITATCTVTARQLVDISLNRLIWIDQNVQRGIKPGSDVPVLLPLADGYPDTTHYIFDKERADDIAEKLLNGERLFLNPLIWNLRPRSFQAYYDEDDRQIFLYDGVFYTPDSHHRHQAIQKAVLTADEAPDDFPNFSPDRAFAVELYFMDVASEGEYFFEKNQLGKQADRSRAFELTTQDSLSAVTKKAISEAASLRGNVNRVTDRLTAKNPQVATLSTLRGVIKSFANDRDHIPEDEIDRIAELFARAYDILATVRPELGHLSQSDRQQVRQALIVDQAVVIHGYVDILKAIARDVESVGAEKASETWIPRLAVLSPDSGYTYYGFSGDVFDRNNPLWRELGLLQATKSGNLTVSNTRQTRATVRQYLHNLVGADNGEGGDDLTSRASST